MTIRNFGGEREQNNNCAIHRTEVRDDGDEGASRDRTASLRSQEGPGLGREGHKIGSGYVEAYGSYDAEHL